MKRSAPLQRKAPLKRTAKPMARTREHRRKPSRRASMPQGLRERVFARAGGHCDRCGTGLRPDAWDAHHRSPRGMGGDPSKNTPENLVALHRECHAWVEANRAAARDQGFLVPDWRNPAEVPVLRHGKSLQLPTATAWVPYTEGV